MKIFIVFVFLITANFSYSQIDNESKKREKDLRISVSDTSRDELAIKEAVILKTPRIFSVTFFNTDKFLLSISDYVTYDDIYLDTLTNNFLTIERKYKDLENPLKSSAIVRIPLKNIKSLGYVIGTQEILGLFIGMGAGGLSGFITGGLGRTYDNKSLDEQFNSSKTPVSTFTIVGMTIGAGLGYVFGGMYSKNEDYELEKYNNDVGKKYSEILKIVKKGLNRYKSD